MNAMHPSVVSTACLLMLGLGLTMGGEARAQSRRPDATPSYLADLYRRCVHAPVPGKVCKVDHIEVMEAKDDHQNRIFVAMQEQHWSDDGTGDDDRHFALFTSPGLDAPFRRIPLDDNGASEHYGLLNKRGGRLREGKSDFIVVEGMGGAGGCGISYYVLGMEGGVWTPYEAQSWSNQVGRFLPRDQYIKLAGAVMSFGMGEGVVTVANPRDTNCCPTGGRIHVTLGLVGHAFKVLSVDRNIRGLPRP